MASQQQQRLLMMAEEAERQLQQRNDEIAKLQERVSSLSQQLHAALYNNSGTDESTKKKVVTHLSPHAVQVHTGGGGGSMGGGGGRPSGSYLGGVGIRQERLGRNASIATQQVLDHLSAQQQPQSQFSNIQQQSSQPPPFRSSALYPSSQQMQGTPLSRVFDMFNSPASSIDYLTSTLFAKDICKLCSASKKILENEPRVVFVQSPIYVFGDVHGNVEDLHFFADNVWRLGMECTAGRFLFLGDYVDRGLSCLECISYLLALKVTLPQKVFLLRGNHETRDVNGWEEHYGERSFIAQCTSRFGNEIGYKVWESCNAVFDRMPLSAVIDGDIFCVHGGIPRPVSSNTTRIQDILTVPKVAGINPPYQHEDTVYQQVASDCIWSDPASEDQELTSVNPMTGFGASLRGGGAICFGNKAVTDFLSQHNFSYILRAHEAHAEGVAVSKGARVFTVFSTSKDHNQGSHALAGCILVDNEKLQVINRSPAYKNQYVHRRDSVSLASVSPDEIQKRMRLGLITQAPVPAPQQHQHHVVQYQPQQFDPSQQNQQQQQSQSQSDEELQDWQDFESDSEDDEEEGADAHGGNIVGGGSGADDAAMDTTTTATPARHVETTSNKAHVFDKNRRSSIDLASLSENSHDDPTSIAEASSAGQADNLYQQASSSHHLLGGGDYTEASDGGRRVRSKKPSVSSIPEDDVRDVELRDADSHDELEEEEEEVDVDL
jgi:diadenosine tetraphosphatase ApaH/serine/threonine PP2A family protein phosphatase